jgi:sugar lactone lactonase YvrE
VKRHRRRQPRQRVHRLHRLRLPAGEFAPGIIAVITPDGIARTVAGDLAFPNGMVVTPDDATLIVAEPYASQLAASGIGADGALSNRRVRAGLGEDHPDGVGLDAEGAVRAADVGNQHCARVRPLNTVTARWPNDFRTPTGQVLAVEATVPSARPVTAGG